MSQIIKVKEREFHQVGDSAVVVINCPMNEELKVTTGKEYPGTIVKVDADTHVKTVNDNGEDIEHHASFNSFNSGYVDVYALLTHEEYRSRVIALYRAGMTEATKELNVREEQLRAVAAERLSLIGAQISE